MPAPSLRFELLHPCLTDPQPSAPLDAAPLSDRQRLGVLLEGCALDAHLARLGRWPTAGWEEARVSGGGRLVAVRIASAEARQRDYPSVRALALLRRLFGSEGIPGRGEGRRVARCLLRRWSLYVTVVGADEIVADVLDSAPFLWLESFAAYRESLVARIVVGQEGETLAVAGRASFRRRALRQAAAFAELLDQVRGPEALALWRGESADEVREPRSAASSPRLVVGAGHQRRHADHDLGRLEASCRLGRWHAAALEAGRLRRAGLDPDTRVRVARLAIEALLYLSRWRRAAEWAAFAERCAGGEALEEARRLRSWVEQESGAAELDPVAMIRRAATALRDRERPPAERARLWLEVGRGRAAVGAESAERAFGHALRQARRGDHPVDLWRAAASLVGARVRRGALHGAEEAAACLRDQARTAGDRRRELEAEVLALRLELGRGHAERVATRAAAILDRPPRSGLARVTGEIGILAARALGWAGRRGEAAGRLGAAPSSAIAVLDPEERAAVWALAGRRDRALEAARRLGREGAWRRLLEDGAVDLARLAPGLDGFRRARLVVDAVLIGGRPLERDRREASDVLSRCGAEALAARLMADAARPWSAACRFLAEPSPGRLDIARLFRDAGYSEVELTWIAGDGSTDRLVGGPGGRAEVVTAVTAGQLVLRCEEPVREDLRALLALVRDRLARQVAPSGRSPAAIADGRGLRAQVEARGGMVGRSRALLDALERIDRLARGEVPVLVLGETGTGKELAAKRLHRASSRRERPLLAVNCAALSESLLLSELFGHARGAFTGADRDRAGVFETAEGGVVFLDEIGDLPLAAQGALLRVLQEQEVRRVGESKARTVDVRVVAATHRDLASLVERGEFRRDLYYRLNVATVTLPPLRERGDDVLLLGRHFLAEHGGALRLAPDAEAGLLACPWPGNVRELRSVVQVAATVHEGDGVLHARDLELPRPEGRCASYHAALDAERRRLLGAALAAAGGRRAEAARRLGITPQAVSYLVRRLGLEPGAGTAMGLAEGALAAVPRRDRPRSRNPGRRHGLS
ncbi:MAG TPA: sigma 54-interacting transcriptional regulator [Thermoanaerobaculia bacterium]|nr:sigma 54-interacting transcriptional regulator [Thermoanaerobaculia bacterium]